MNTLMQQTSLFAYHNFVKPKMAETQKEVYEVLRIHGSMTDKEIANILGWDRSSVNGRRNELCDKGLVRDSGKTRIVNNRPAILWEINN